MNDGKCEVCGSVAGFRTVSGDFCNDHIKHAKKVCDFCVAENLAFVYPCKPFNYIRHGELIYESTKNWAACSECSRLIEAKDYNALNLRAIPYWTAHNEGLQTREQALDDIKHFHRGFTSHRFGEAIPVEEYDWGNQDAYKPIRRSIHADYMKALEVRAEWIQWAKSQPHDLERLGPLSGTGNLVEYIDVLERGDTFFMDRHFCELVDKSRMSVPGDIKFETDWVLRPWGWMYLAEPFLTPPFRPSERNSEAVKRLSGMQFGIRAVGWRPIEVGTVVRENDGTTRLVRDKETWFACFYEYGFRPGFNAWSYFAICDGDILSDRIERFEQLADRLQFGSGYQTDDRTFHEMRWVYAAMHLMSQRLATRVRHATDRPTRKRIQRHRKQEAPAFVDVVTLRRLEQDRERDPKGKQIDWSWRWMVSGHWRNQWYPAGGVHKRTFIDSYVKGPPEKPLKPTTKIYVATR